MLSPEKSCLHCFGALPSHTELGRHLCFHSPGCCCSRKPPYCRKCYAQRQLNDTMLCCAVASFFSYIFQIATVLALHYTTSYIISPDLQKCRSVSKIIITHFTAFFKCFLVELRIFFTFYKLTQKSGEFVPARLIVDKLFCFICLKKFYFQAFQDKRQPL